MWCFIHFEKVKCERPGRNAAAAANAPAAALLPTSNREPRTFFSFAIEIIDNVAIQWHGFCWRRRGHG